MITTKSSAAPAHPTTPCETKTRACSGCGGRFPNRETLQVGPEQAEHSVEAREGERWCRPCARRAGIL